MGMQWHRIVPPEHFNLFGTRLLQRLLAGAEWEGLMTAKTGKTFTLQHVTPTLADSLSGNTADRTGLPIHRRDNVFLLGRSRS
jgi:hypothetical protein